jgi:uncharacterized membrane protein
MSLFPLVVLHVSAGLVAILSGFVAMIYRKGSRGHRLSGNIFFVSMLCMAGSATFMAVYLFHFHGLEKQITNIFAASMTLYLVTTAWWAARRNEIGTSIFDWSVLLVALALLACYLTFGVEAARSATGLKYGYPPYLYFIFAIVALFGASGDVRILIRGGIAGKYRIARHLWRMSLGLFLAVASFFLGQQKVFPSAWRGLKIWFVPPLVSLILLFYWLIRIRFGKSNRDNSSTIPKRSFSTESLNPSVPGQIVVATDRRCL